MTNDHEEERDSQTNLMFIREKNETLRPSVNMKFRDKGKLNGKRQFCTAYMNSINLLGSLSLTRLVRFWAYL